MKSTARLLGTVAFASSLAGCVALPLAGLGAALGSAGAVSAVGSAASAASVGSAAAGTAASGAGSAATASQSGPDYNQQAGPGYASQSGPGYRQQAGPGYASQSGPGFHQEAGPGYAKQSGPAYNQEASAVPPGSDAAAVAGASALLVSQASRSAAVASCKAECRGETVSIGCPAGTTPSCQCEKQPYATCDKVRR